MQPHSCKNEEIKNGDADLPNYPLKVDKLAGSSIVYPQFYDIEYILWGEGVQ